MKKWFEELDNLKWLLIFDNADKIDDPEETRSVMELIPRAEKGCVLVTSRNRESEWELAHAGIEIQEMKESEAVEFLVSRSRRRELESGQDAISLVHVLGCLPLAIEQAAGYIRVRNISMARYMALYEAKKSDALTKGLPKSHKVYYKETVATTWMISFQQLKAKSPSSVLLVQLFAFMNPDEILVEFLKEGRTGFGPKLEEIFSNGDLLNDSLFALQEFSLVRVWEEGAKINIHRLVQRVIKDDLEEVGRRCMINQVIQLGLSAFPIVLGGINREKCRRYRSQAMACIGHKAADKDKESKRGILAEHMAGYLFYDGYFLEAVNVSLLVIDIRKRTLGPEHRETLGSMNGLVWAYGRAGELSEGAKLALETVEIAKHALGQDDEDTLLYMNALGWIYVQLRKLIEAKELFREVIEICRKSFGEEARITVATINELAWTYTHLGDYEEAVQLHQKALELRKKHEEPENTGIMWSMHGLAASYSGQGRLDEAAKLYGETLQLRTSVLGPEHPDTLLAKSELAGVNKNLGLLREASELD